MGFSNILRGVTRGVTSVGRAVQAASQKLDQAVQPGTVRAEDGSTVPQSYYAGDPVKPALIGPPDPNAAPAEGAPAAPKGFKLPDLGPAPDPNAPEFQGDEGKKKYDEASQHYQHRQDIHQAFMDLDKIYTEAHPGRDFEKEYRENLAAQEAHDRERPRGSNLARAALALGDFNPAVAQSGRSGLDTYNERVGEAQAQSDRGFSQRMTLQMKMHEQRAAEAETKGNFKQALAEQEKLALMKLDEQERTQAHEMEKVKAQQQGATERANIRADAMEKTAHIRASVIGQTHGLSGNFLSQFEKEAAKAVAKLLGPRDLMKEYTPADLDSITTYLEHLAEMFHDQQEGTTDGGNKYLGTHPNKRTAPKSAAKEQF